MPDKPYELDKSDKEILLIGGGGHCRSCIDVIENIPHLKIAGIVDQSGKNRSGSVMGYPVIGDDNDLEALKKKYDYALITIGQTGTSHIRQKIFKQLKQMDFILPAVVSPLAYVSSHGVINEGSIVMHRAIVNAGTRIGNNCILNTMCLVEHDVKIGDHTHISTAAILNGAVEIGPGSFVGSNATVVHGVELPEEYFFKAGSLVVSHKDGQPIKGEVL